MQLDVSMIRDEVNGALFQIRDSLRLKMDVLNREVDDVRTC